MALLKLLSSLPLPLPYSQSSTSRSRTRTRTRTRTSSPSSFPSGAAVLVPRCISPTSATVGSDSKGTDLPEGGELDDDKKTIIPITPSGEFVEVGFVCSVHGLNGELKVLSSTAFPELRFCMPGTRWLRSVVLGKEMIREVEILGGRQGHKGAWVLNISGVDSVDEAREIVGSTVLVREDDRPILEEGDFYTRDLLGMRVFLKENGKLVGTVVNVVNYGSSDLLQVMLDTTKNDGEIPSSPKLESGAVAPLVWIPFVEQIVPVVDVNTGEMQITPPKGLLELNLRSDAKSKKERSKLEWMEKKKFQKRVAAAKKKLNAMGQAHVLQGFSYGEKEEKRKLANQILDIDYKFFQHALDNVSTPDRFNLSEYLDSEVIRNRSTNISQIILSSFPSDVEVAEHLKLLSSGVDLLGKNKVCIVLVVNEGNNQYSGRASFGKPSTLDQMQELLSGEKFLKVHDQRISAPLIIVSPANEVESYQQLFLENDYFGFDIEKVRFLKTAGLPVLADRNPGRILMKSPWEMLLTPVGSGGIFSVLSAHHIINDIRSWGVDYVEVCELISMSPMGQSMLLGLVKSTRSDVGFRVSCSEYPDMENGFDVVLSMEYLNEIITDPGSHIHLNAVAAKTEHVELTSGERIKISGTESNSICFRSSVYSLLKTCSSGNVCVLRTAVD